MSGRVGCSGRGLWFWAGGGKGASARMRLVCGGDGVGVGVRMDARSARAHAGIHAGEWTEMSLHEHTTVLRTSCGCVYE